MKKRPLGYPISWTFKWPGHNIAPSRTMDEIENSEAQARTKNKKLPLSVLFQESMISLCCSRDPRNFPSFRRGSLDGVCANNPLLHASCCLPVETALSIDNLTSRYRGWAKQYHKTRAIVTSTGITIQRLETQVCYMLSRNLR